MRKIGAAEIIAAVLIAACVWVGVESLAQAERHHGAGVIAYGTNQPNINGDTGGENPKTVSEQDYKRHHRVTGVGSLLLGAFFAGCVLTGRKSQRARD